jgi:hypothetical protein
MEALMDIAIDASFLFSYTNSAKLRKFLFLFFINNSKKKKNNHK